MNRRVLVYGHRGTRRAAPENSLRALRLALDQGADGVELDVRLCASGEVVVLHDRDLARVAGVAVQASEASLDELRAHDLGQGERVPTLTQALELVLRRGALLNVELKTDVPDPDALVVAVCACVAERASEERAQILFSSFGRSLCERLCVESPSARVGYLFERAAECEPLPTGVMAVHPHQRLVDRERIATWHAAGLVVNAWTVNEAARARELASSGVDAIITDDVPHVLAALRA